MPLKDAKLPALLVAAALVLGVPAIVYATEDVTSPAADAGTEDVTAASPDGLTLQQEASQEDDGDDHEDHDHKSHGDQTAREADHGRYRTPWPPAEGSVPEGPEGLTQVSRLTIEGEPDEEEIDEYGINITGSGTHDDPYVLEGLRVSSQLELKDTFDYWIIKENYIDGTLRLNWNGDKVFVHHNNIRDLRVNENDERMGDATAGLITEDEIDIVGQIRHYDGVFSHNEVGPVPDGFFDPLITDAGELMPVPFRDQLALNIDGFNGGLFTENTINGAVDMQLHGHHHSSCFGCISHNHGDEDKAEEKDHTDRWHEVWFLSNDIQLDGATTPAFRYQDTGHAGDDRTANSEPYEELEGDHQHHTRIHIEGNQIDGGPFEIDVINADDEYHDERNPATMVVRGNTLHWTLPEQSLRTGWMSGLGNDALYVTEAKEMDLTIEQNTFVLDNGEDQSLVQEVDETLGWEGSSGMADALPAAIHLYELSDGTLVIQDNTLEGAHYGVFAEYLDEKVDWTVEDNEYNGIDEKVVYDDSVESKPNR